MSQLSTAVKTALTATVKHWRDTDLADLINLERGRPGTLELFLEPENEQELSSLVLALRTHGVATTTIAGQSGLVEAQRPHGVAIGMGRFQELGELTLADGTEVPPARWTELGRLTPEQLRGATVRVGAGLSIDGINEALAPVGLKLPIVMGSTASATAGACAANGSAGANAVRYGTAAQLARRVRGVLGTGEIVCQEVPPTPLETTPDRCRIRSDRFSHGHLLVGSQGAFGLITEVVYEVVPTARDQALVLIPVPDVATASHLHGQLERQFNRGDTGIELFEIIRHQTMERALAHAEQTMREGVGEAPYWVLVQVTSDADPQPSAFGSALLESVLTFLMTQATDLAGNLAHADGNLDFDHQPHRLLELREACSEMSRLLPKQSYDVVVPVNRLDEFVQQLEARMDEQFPEFELGVFGHGGVGALHLHAIAPDAEQLAAAQTRLDALVFDLVQALDGSPWAEHGVGSKWGREWQRRTPAEVVAAMLEIKKEHDPDNVLGSRLFGFQELLRN
jgi:FAD/FMN-containing dehydrogenase